jgi:hypothetical protein
MIMRTSLTLALATCAFLSSGAALSQDDHFIDLSVPDADENDCGNMGCGSARAVDHAPIPEVKLTVQLDSIERTTYSVGEDVMCQIRLTNVGEQPIAIPWGRDPQIAVPCCPSSRYWDLKGKKLDAFFGLRFRDPSGAFADVILGSLYGAMEDSSTYQVLLPRRTALIRFGGPLQEEQLGRIVAAGKKLELPGEFVATAFYHLNDSSLPNDYKTIESCERVRLVICKRPQGPE